MLRINFFGLVLAILLSGLASADSLPDSVEAALSRARLPLSAVGIVVQEVSETVPLIAVNAEEAMSPASTMKLLTTFAALETLGPSYRWKTEAYLNGKLEDGVLRGDLIFKGYGDPKLTIEQFWLWLREIRQRGLREIQGNIVLDHSFFEPIEHDPSAFDNDPTRAYNVGASAILLNFNAVHLHLIPDGKKTIAWLDPDLAGYTLHNHITASAAMKCGHEKIDKVILNGRHISLEGRIPSNCGEIDEYFTLLPQGEYFLAAFSALWKELGGSLQGELRFGLTPSGQAPYSTYVSPPLSDVIRDINKFSNNSMARQLFLTLGTTSSQGDRGIQNAAGLLPFGNNSSQVDATLKQTLPSNEQNGGDSKNDEYLSPMLELPEMPIRTANLERSNEAIQLWLKKQQLQFPELVLENGSGLSRKERISARHLSELLQRAMSSPYYAELVSSLPISGMDGTVKRRFNDTDTAGYAHLKTGSLKGVKSIAGYVQAKSGKRWIIVFIVNHTKAALAEPAQDALIRWVHEQY